MGDIRVSSEDWYAINELIGSIYTSSADNVFRVTLDIIKSLVPYSHSLYYLQHKGHNTNVFFGMTSSDIPQSYIRSYIDYYSKLDFINWYSANCQGSDVFRERDIISEDAMHKSSFLENWMLPANLYYAVGIIVADADTHYGAMFIYRGREEKDFSDMEIEKLRILNHHLCNRFSSLSENEFRLLYAGQAEEETTMFQCLTKRETEIINEIRAGCLRSELCERLYITENTLNKHLDNIYKKLEINSFEELLRKIS